MSTIRTHRFIDTEKTLVKFGDPTVASQHALNAYSIKLPALLHILKEETGRSALYGKVWGKAETIFKVQKDKLLEQSQSSIPDECHIAIIAYTLEIVVSGTKLYQDFNERSRKLTDQPSWDVFPYKSLYCLLIRSADGVHNNPPVNSHVYRGVNFHYSSDSFAVGHQVSFNQFTSTSAKLEVANDFKGGRGTVIEIPRGTEEAIGIELYSPYSESEVLVFPWSTFKVMKWEREGPTHRIVLRSLSNKSTLEPTVRTCVMSEQMRQHAISCATEALETYGTRNYKDVAGHVSKEFNDNYGKYWQCFAMRVGNAGWQVWYDDDSFLSVNLGDTTICLFKRS